MLESTSSRAVSHGRGARLGEAHLIRAGHRDRGTSGFGDELRRAGIDPVNPHCAPRLVEVNGDRVRTWKPTCEK